ncbi:hypothetical protein cyc_04454 [Cyclospora cayetanensis]|uniref:Transmembrane protein n=1 Tax=Cyclospora cayetanensis TaxID=88456 RepID=A0A1D3D8D4_9EIME|nr:hypothetical protein cyc_04454 [Cyclospora cayetanensis]
MVRRPEEQCLGMTDGFSLPLWRSDATASHSCEAAADDCIAANPDPELKLTLRQAAPLSPPLSSPPSAHPSVEPLLLTKTSQQRNAIYGDSFYESTLRLCDVDLQEMQSRWTILNRSNVDTSVVRTVLTDLTAFALCAELNLELEDLWVLIPEGTKQVGYTWRFWVSEPLGSEAHLRNNVASLVPSNLSDMSVAVEYTVSEENANFLDKEAFDCKAITQGTRTVLGSLKYKGFTVENGKLLSVPEITLGDDSGLCGLLLLQALLRRCKNFGLTEIRLSAASGDLTLLKAAIASGFRPVQVYIGENAEVYQTLSANPQLPEPTILEQEQQKRTIPRIHPTDPRLRSLALRSAEARLGLAEAARTHWGCLTGSSEWLAIGVSLVLFIASYDAERMNTFLSATYFQAMAVLSVHKNLSIEPKPARMISAPAPAKSPVEPQHLEFVHRTAGLNLQFGHGSLVFAALGTAFLLALVFWVFKKKMKGGGGPFLASKAKFSHRARYKDERYLEAPPHWEEAYKREPVYEEDQDNSPEALRAVASFE